MRKSVVEQKSATSKQIDVLCEDVKELGGRVLSMEDKIKSMDETLVNTSSSHYNLFSQFELLSNQFTLQEAKVVDLIRDNTIIKDIQEKVNKYSTTIEDLKSRLDKIDAFIIFHEKKAKEEQEFREQRAKERKVESRLRSGEAKTNKRWVIGIGVTILLFLLGSVSTSFWQGIKFVSEKNELAIEQHETRYVKDVQTIEKATDDFKESVSEDIKDLKQSNKDIYEKILDILDKK